MIRLGVASLSSNLITSSVPVGQKGRVHIWGQNNTGMKQELGIHWIVRDPDGLITEDYEDWAGVFLGVSPIDPGETHEFTGDWFEFFKEGKYTIAASLFMNSDKPVVVDSYEGTLCIVVAELPPEVPPEVPPEEEVPPEVNWWPIILIGGGIALATVLKPKKTRT